MRLDLAALKLGGQETETADDGIIADGAIRSGKTVCMSLSFVIWAMDMFIGQNFAMCGKTIGSFRRNVLFCDEVALMPESFVNQATGRCLVDGLK